LNALDSWLGAVHLDKMVIIFLSDVLKVLLF
jgi:hypothetical protein